MRFCLGVRDVSIHSRTRAYPVDQRLSLAYSIFQGLVVEVDLGLGTHHRSHTAVGSDGRRIERLESAT